MIKSFSSKTLQRTFESGSKRGLPPEFASKISRVLFALDQAEGAMDLGQPGFGLHELSGNKAGIWSIVISRNWRIVFRFDGNDIVDVDFIDYH